VADAGGLQIKQDIRQANPPLCLQTLRAAAEVISCLCERDFRTRAQFCACPAPTALSSYILDQKTILCNPARGHIAVSHFLANTFAEHREINLQTPHYPE